MTTGDELCDLAERLAGMGWQDLFPDEWTPEQHAAYDRATLEEQMAHLERMLDQPIAIDDPASWPPEYAGQTFYRDAAHQLHMCDDTGAMRQAADDHRGQT